MFNLEDFFKMFGRFSNIKSLDASGETASRIESRNKSFYTFFQRLEYLQYKWQPDLYF